MTEKLSLSTNRAFSRMLYQHCMTDFQTYLHLLLPCWSRFTFPFIPLFSWRTQECKSLQYTLMMYIPHEGLENHLTRYTIDRGMWNT